LLVSDEQPVIRANAKVAISSFFIAALLQEYSDFSTGDDGSFY
jgi:hypothetical protein